MRALLLAALLTVALAGCGEGATAPPPPAAAAEWERIVPGGDCECSDGSEYAFWERRADAKRVVLYLEDGGACFSEETCAPDSGLYHVRGEGPLGEGGILEFADARNPLRDHSVVYVPYCTADVHLGDTTATYGGVTVRHKGFVNGSAALDRLVAEFPDATEVVVVGESAGSIAAPLYGGLVANRLPEAQVTVLADGSGAFPDHPRANAIIAGWGARRALPRWAGHTFPGLFAATGRHAPGVALGRIDHARDAHQAGWFPRIGLRAGDLPGRMAANERQIEATGVTLHSFMLRGDGHTVLTEDEFFTAAAGGRPLVDWVKRLIAGEPVADVR